MTRLGRNGPHVSRVGLGCMGMSDFYGPADEATSIATIALAVDRGVDLLDTGDFYGMGHNEMLVGRAVKEIGRDKVVLSVKFGALRDPGGGFGGLDTRPVAIRNFVAYSLKRLGTDHIDIYRPARLDPAVPIEETVGAIARLIEEGHVRYLGLSEVSAETLRRAHAVHPVTDLQIEYSLMSRGVEAEILPTLRELGIGMTAYGVLSRGLIADAAPDSDAGIRGRLPRFSGENLAANRALVEALGAVARERGLTTSQVAIAWVAAQGEDIVPLVGTRKAARIDEALAALEVPLSADDLARIEAAIPADAVRGTRYDAHQMEVLDSERG
jgi:aryl-alcohol dehydrogenase-like predicted oxidoreductase